MSGSQKNKSKGCSEPEAAIKRRIAKRAATLGAELPSELPSAEQKLANLLSATRVLMAECALANSWDKAEAASYARALDFAEVVLNSLLLRQEPGQQKPRPQNAVPQRGYVTKNATQQTAAISALSISGWSTLPAWRVWYGAASRTPRTPQKEGPEGLQLPACRLHATNSTA